MKALPPPRTDAKALRDALAPYTERSTVLALAIFARDAGLLAVATGLALWVESYALKTLFAVIAGTAIAALFVIGHDGAHCACTGSKRLNALLGRLALLPSLHNFTLWRIVHNRMHHRDTCVKGRNSWSPLSKVEYDALPYWRRCRERLYRTPVLGFAAYYAVNRWWKEKFFPPRHLRTTQRLSQWRDFALLLAALVGLFAAFWGATLVIEHLAFWEAVLWGFVIPQVVWNTLMGFTVYAQHTHPQVPWFRTDEEAATHSQAALSVHMVFPKWYGWLSNHIMEHPAHHVNTKVPFYRLAAAQRRLNTLLGETAVVERFSPVAFWQTMRRCKLYDYDGHRWLGYDGSPTAEVAAATAVGRASAPATG